MLLFVYDNEMLSESNYRYRVRDLNESLVQNFEGRFSFVSAEGARSFENVKIHCVLMDGYGLVWEVCPTPDTPGFITDDLSVRKCQSLIVEWKSNSLARERIKQVEDGVHLVRLRDHSAVLFRVKVPGQWQFWKRKPQLFRLFSIENCCQGANESQVFAYGGENLGTIRVCTPASDQG